MFKGRLSRSDYIIQFIILTVINGIFGAIAETAEDASAIVWIMILFLLTTIYGFSITIRRLHDFNASGWWCLLGLIPFVNFIFALVLFFKTGVDEGNIYTIEEEKSN